jgi:hypothetical protein
VDVAGTTPANAVTVVYEAGTCRSTGTAEQLRQLPSSVAAWSSIFGDWTPRR